MRGRVATLLFVATGALAAPAVAQPRATSAYTTLDLERCVVIAEVEEGGSVSWRCRGHGDIALLVSVSDDRYDLDAGTDSGVWESAGRFSFPGRRVEWRMRRGQPFAIIYRLSLSGLGERSSSVLGVEKIGRPGAPGCVVAWIDGRLSNANALARARADARGASFRCGRDEPEQHGEAQ